MLRVFEYLLCSTNQRHSICNVTKQGKAAKPYIGEIRMLGNICLFSLRNYFKKTLTIQIVLNRTDGVCSGFLWSLALWLLTHIPSCATTSTLPWGYYVYVWIHEYVAAGWSGWVGGWVEVLVVVTKHLTGQRTPPNFRLTLVCLALPTAAGDTDTCLGLGRLWELGVAEGVCVCVCVCIWTDR